MASDNRFLSINELLLAFLIASGVVFGVVGLSDAPPFLKIPYRIVCAIAVLGDIWWLYRKPGAARRIKNTIKRDEIIGRVIEVVSYGVAGIGILALTIAGIIWMMA